MSKHGMYPGYQSEKPIKREPSVSANVIIARLVLIGAIAVILVGLVWAYWY